MYRKICLPALAILGLTSFELLAATHTWSGAVSGLWSNDANWTGGAPQNGETDVVLVFPAGLGVFNFMTNDVTMQNVNRIEFRGGQFVLSGNALPMSGQIVLMGDATANFNTPLVLLSDLNVFLYRDPQPGNGLRLSGPVSGAFGVTTSAVGPSILTLAGANQYSGSTTVVSGALEVGHAQGLGAGNGLPETGTVVKPDAMLSLFNAEITNEALSIGGTTEFPGKITAACYPAPCVWGGPITLTGHTTVTMSPGSQLFLDGAIGGVDPFYLTSRSAGTLVTLRGASTFSGPTSLEGYIAADVLVSTPSTFELGSNPSYDNRLRVAPGAVIGRFELGPGSGELGVAGAVAGSAAITNGLLLANPFGKLSIRIQSAVLADRFAVGGAVDVTGATLAVDSSAFDPAAGTSYVIVANDGVDAILGTFAGLPEGWIFTANARNYRISYAGGDGNDIVLTRVVGTPVELQTFSAE